MLWLIICHKCEVTTMYIVCRCSLMNCVGLFECGLSPVSRVEVSPEGSLSRVGCAMLSSVHSDVFSYIYCYYWYAYCVWYVYEFVYCTLPVYEFVISCGAWRWHCMILLTACDYLSLYLFIWWLYLISCITMYLLIVFCVYSCLLWLFYMSASIQFMETVNLLSPDKGAM